MTWYSELLKTQAIGGTYHVEGLCKGYEKEYPHDIWPYMVQYLHFRVLKFPLQYRRTFTFFDAPDWVSQLLFMMKCSCFGDQQLISFHLCCNGRTGQFITNHQPIIMSHACPQTHTYLRNMSRTMFDC